MKKKIYLSFLTLLGLILTGCGSNPNPSSPTTSVEDPTTSIVEPTTTPATSDDPISSEPTTSEDEPIDPSTIIVPDFLTIHFRNDTEDYSNLVFWLWSDAKTPNKEFTPDGEDKNGLYITVNAKEVFGTQHTKVGVILKSKGDWSYQTLDSFISYGKFQPTNVNGQYVLEVFATLNSKQMLDIVASAEDANKDKVKNAVFSSDLSKVTVTGSGPMASYSLYAFDSSYYSYNLVEQKQDAVKDLYKVTSGTIDNQTTTEFDILLNPSDIKVNRNYTVEAVFHSAPDSTSSYIASFEHLYDTDLFLSTYYDGDDLGAHVKDNKTTFKVWSPVSAQMTLNLYLKGNQSTFEDFVFRPEPYDLPTSTHEMSVDEKGVWSITFDENLHGTYYTFTANNFFGVNECADPYGSSAGLNGTRSMVVDFTHESVQVEEFNALPDKWDGHEVYDIKSSMDLTVSEVHIRDLTADSTWSANPEDDELRGTYKGFIKPGTTYSKNGKTVKTGFDHLEELGVNAVQLLPVFDQDNNEFEPVYNWGYNPLNYNVVDGSYSTNPKDGSVRIKEFRELVAAFANNDNNTRIIMDVVYNHVSNAMTSSFNQLVPFYYFRLTETGALSNGSGCGNEFKTEAPMASKFIVDSLKFWATTYKIKGFRFDLMGLIDIDTLAKAAEELYKIDPDIVMYGEGWTGYGSTTLPYEKMAVSENVYAHLYQKENSIAVGCFNDSGRNALKGGNGFNYGDFWGFISQGQSDLSNDTKSRVNDMLLGVNTGKGGNPIQTVNYASCHDNFTLFDQLNWTLSDDGGKTPPSATTVAKASVAVNTMVLMSNGIAFINGGEELMRTKIDDRVEEEGVTIENRVDMYGKLISGNSYNATDYTNSYKYDRKVLFLDYFNMYKDAVEIRKNLKPVYYPNNFEGIELNTWGSEAGTCIALYRAGKDGKDYHMLVNGRNLTQKIGCEQHELLLNNSTKTPSWSNYAYTLDQYNVIVVAS